MTNNKPNLTPTNEREFRLLAIGAADGRYQNKLTELPQWVSEYGLIKQRIHVECEWLIALSEAEDITHVRALSVAERDYLRGIAKHLSLADAVSVKDTERTTNHDVKAVEYFVKSKIAANENLADLLEWVHFACTSEDINNTAYGLMLKGAVQQVVMPQMELVVSTIDELAANNADIPMLSRTHGQTASPTTLGKEMKNVAARLQRQLGQLQAIQLMGKFNGAVGNFNAHALAFPDADWQVLSADFVTSLGLTYNPWTTQIEPHDYIAEVFHSIMRFNQVLLDFDRDIWSYISIGYFSQRKIEGETGSSTMPHKINPIDFENSEGNVGVANALMDHMAQKLPVSRWQRDLSDSTVLRNIGTALAHSSIAYQATLKGLSRLDVNEAAIRADINQAWEVLAEAVQTVMRKHGMSEPYERLKTATRGRVLDETSYQEVLSELELPAEAMAELSGLRPESYIGLAAQLARLELP
ncbi:MAG: adenylosuccinate lyase [Limisphaerales bacterium]|jgi:adenylosuccinate lyase